MDNSPQARTGQVEVPNVGSIQSGTPQLYQQSSGIQSTNSQLLNGASNAQILVPSGEPNSPSSSKVQTSTSSSSLGWIVLVAALLITGVIVAIINSRKRSVSNTVEEKSEPAQDQQPVTVKNSSVKSKSKSKNRKKTKKKKK